MFFGRFDEFLVEDAGERGIGFKGLEVVWCSVLRDARYPAAVRRPHGPGHKK